MADKCGQCNGHPRGDTAGFPNCIVESESRGFRLPSLTLQVNLNTGGVSSEANVTDIHEALHFHTSGGPDNEHDPCAFLPPLCGAFYSPLLQVHAWRHLKMKLAPHGTDFIPDPPATAVREPLEMVSLFRNHNASPRPPADSIGVEASASGRSGGAPTDGRSWPAPTTPRSMSTMLPRARCSIQCKVSCWFEHVLK